MVAHWVLDPLGADKQRYRAGGAPGLALCVPNPLHALTVSQHASGASVVGHGVPDPVGVNDPPVGSRSLGDVGNACCVNWQCRGTLGGLGGGHWVGWEGHRRPRVGFCCWCWVWFGVPLSFPSVSRPVCPWWAPPRIAQTAYLGCGTSSPPDTG